MKLMKSCITRILAAALVAVTLLSLTACGGVPSLTPNEKGGYVNAKTDVVYYPAPDCYEARSYNAEEPVALNDGVHFYAVDGTENDTWLYSPDFGILLYAEGQTLPTLGALEPTLMKVILDDGGISKTLYEVESEDKIDAILDAYEEGASIEYPGKRANYKFYLKLYSDKTPWIVYNLMFVQYAEDLTVTVKDADGEISEVNYGKNFLYNRAEDRFVPIGDELQEYIDDYYHNADAE